MPNVSEKLSASSTASNESKTFVRHSSGSVTSTLKIVLRADETTSLIPAKVCLRSGVAFESQMTPSVFDTKRHNTMLPARQFALTDASAMEQMTDSRILTLTSGSSKPTPILATFLATFVLRIAIPRVSQGPH